MYPLTKRALDIAAAAIGLTLLAPLFLGISIAIRLDSPGPVFYVATRVGRRGQPFRMYKFRTMVPNAEAIGGSSTADDDPRVTRLGQWLRRRKIDELPQLFNVFGGSMSLVGPRPQVQWAVDRYSPEERRVLSVRPGITDPASLRFPDEGAILLGSTDPDRDYFEKIHPEKMRLSLAYIDQRSFRTDIRIILQTLARIVR